MSLIKMDMKAIYAVLCLFFVVGCDYSDDRLVVENRSGNRIVVEAYLDSIPNLKGTNKTEYYLDVIIEPKESKQQFRVGNSKGWSVFIANSVNNRLNLFVFQIDSLEEYGIDSVITMRVYDKYMFSETELDKMNWKVIIE